MTFTCGLSSDQRLDEKKIFSLKEGFKGKNFLDVHQCTLKCIPGRKYNEVYGLCIPVYSFDLRCLSVTFIIYHMFVVTLLINYNMQQF